MSRYGYIPDFGDPRDHAFSSVRAPAARPKSVDLRPKLPPSWDQGQLGSCTAFALTALVAYLHGFEGSQLWLYYKERAIERTIKQDAGAQIRDGIKVLAKQGLPIEADWPYVPAKFAKAPPRKANTDAKKSLVQSYQRLNGPADYLDCLAGGCPFVIGISVFDSFESDAVAASGDVPMPKASEKLLGGHAIAIVGYDEDGRYIARNSWGTGWGDHGAFRLPAAYLASTDLATDAWRILA